MPDVYTLGFSNRTWEATLALLERQGIERLVDVRTLPGSRRTPQFNQERLKLALPEARIEYIHLKSLGGFRKLRDSRPENAGWRNAGFRAYADYMQTAEFSEALGELIRLFREKRTVYCCTEAVFWRCHRALISDALAARGFEVVHILDPAKTEPHRITAFARLEGARVTYPAEQGELWR